MRSKLIVDIDEVILDIIPELLNIYNLTFSGTLSQIDLIGKRIEDLISIEQSTRLQEEIANPMFYSSVKPMEHSQQVLAELNGRYDIFIVSACIVNKTTLLARLEWLEKYFSFIPVTNIVFCGTKRIISGDVMVDDNAFNLEGFDGRKILFEAAHNQNIYGFERADNWQTIALKLL